MVPALLSLLLLAIVLRDSLHHWVVEHWTRDHVALVSVLRDRIDDDILQARRLIERVAATQEFSSLPELERIDPVLKGIPEELERDKREFLEFLRTQGRFSVVFVLTPEGGHYMSHPFSVQRALMRYSLADRPYFQQALRTRQSVVSGGLVGADGRPAIVVGVPVFDAAGKPRLFLGGVLHLETLSSRIDAASIAPYDRAIVVDEQGRLIADSATRSLSAAALEPLDATIRLMREDAQGGAGDVSGEEVRQFVATDQFGVAWLTYEARMATGWKLILLRERDRLLQEISSEILGATALAAGSVMLPSLLGLFLALRFSRRWQRADAKLRVANSRLEERVAQRTEALAQSEARLRLTASVFSYAREGILLTDAVGDIIDVNDSFTRITGYARHEVLGRNPRLLSSGRQTREFYTGMWALLLAQGYWSGEVWNRRKGGQEYAELLTISAIRGADGVVTNYLGLFTDIMPLMQQQHQLQIQGEHLAHRGRLLILGEMASIMAHEINQPLAAITSYADLCVQELDELPRVQNLVSRIQQQALRAGDIVWRMHGFARRSRNTYSPLRIDQVVAGIVSWFAYDEHRDVRFDVAVPSDLPHALADSVQIEQVLINLIRNGIQAMEGSENSRTITIEAQYLADSGEIVLRVGDRGCGVPGQVAMDVFKPFFTTRDTGLGLGLSICQSIVTAHGGRLWCGLRPGGGSVFSFTLPRAERAEREVESADEA
ncbi:MAG: PAS domain S-box protein [Rhodocyclales bacterium]|nr:PAS domain S-box protein [Rhodocyclales bacterium]